MVTGSGPARTIVAVSESEAVDLIMLATHGRGGLDRLFMGSVADRVVQQTRRPVFLVPVQERRIKHKVSGSLNADRGQGKRASL
jgi:nucleotide-binding universal stress UspA family protein